MVICKSELDDIKKRLVIRDAEEIAKENLETAQKIQKDRDIAKRRKDRILDLDRQRQADGTFDDIKIVDTVKKNGILAKA